MKRSLCILLVACLLLAGCRFSAQGLREPVTFYYLRETYRYGTPDGVIVGESRESSGHGGDLNYLLSMYLMGPEGEGLTAALPPSTQILAMTQEGGTITLTLSDLGKQLTEAQYSLACGCLAMTVMGLCQADTVIMESGDRSVTMTRDNITIYDDSAAVAGGETQ